MSIHNQNAAGPGAGDFRHPAEWIRYGAWGHVEGIIVEKDWDLHRNTPVLPRSLRHSIGRQGPDAAPAEVYSRTVSHNDLMPLLWDKTREPRGVAAAVTGPVSMEMVWDGNFPELLDLPMVFSQYYQALAPARYFWGRLIVRNPDGEVISRELRRLGASVGLIQHNPDDPNFVREMTGRQGGLTANWGWETSAHLWRASGPAYKVGKGRWRVQAFPIIKPFYRIQPRFEWVKVGEACYVWEPPAPTTFSSFQTGVDTAASEFPIDPIIYDLWEFRSGVWSANYGPDGDTNVDVYPEDWWLYKDGPKNPQRVLAARGTTPNGFAGPEASLTVAFGMYGMQLYGGGFLYNAAAVNIDNTMPVASSLGDNSWRNFQIGGGGAIGYRRAGDVPQPGGQGAQGAELDFIYRNTFQAYMVLGAYPSYIGADGRWYGQVSPFPFDIPDTGFDSAVGGKPLDYNDPGVEWGWWDEYFVKTRPTFFDRFPPGHPPPFLKASVFGDCGFAEDDAGRLVDSIEGVSEYEALRELGRRQGDSADAAGEEDETPPTTIDCTGFVTWTWSQDSSGGGHWDSAGVCADGCVAPEPVFDGDFHGDEVQVDCRRLE